MALQGLQSWFAWDELSRTSVLMIIVTVLMLFFFKKMQEFVFKQKGMTLPPRIPHKIPFLGQAIDFNTDPIIFLRNAYEKYGEVFSFTMVGQTFTYLIGPDSSSILFNSKNDVLNAEEVYGNLTAPVVGEGVGYGVGNAVFMEQKKIMKMGLNVSQYKKYVPMMTQETKEYFKNWGAEGERDLLMAMEELVLLVVSRCLHGDEIRSIFNERLAKLYADLDGGLTPLAWLFPSWMPFPSFRKRDRAHREVKKIFYEVIEQRRSSGTDNDDFFQILIDCKPNYKNGSLLTDDEIAGMCMGLLVAGQHTSSTTSSWLGFFLAKNTHFQNSCYEEQLRICGSDPDMDITYEQLKEMVNLDRCLKETLRLRPPVMTMMRMAKEPLTYKEYTIPPGHQVCVSPSVNQCLEEKWSPDPLGFNPDRFLEENASKSDKYSYVPFGAGHHRCVGESFAYLQIKTMWSVLLRKYEFELANGHFPPVNFTTLIHTPYKPIIKYKLRQADTK